MSPDAIVQLIEERRAALERELCEVTGARISLIANVHESDRELVKAALRAGWSPDRAEHATWISNEDTGGKVTVFWARRRVFRKTAGQGVTRAV